MLHQVVHSNPTNPTKKGGLTVTICSSEPGNLVCVSDVDGTLYLPDQTDYQTACARRVRDFIDDHGTFAVATAQTVEMCLSEASYNASRDRGFARPQPLLRKDPDGLRSYVAPESIPSRIPFTDPTMVMSMGTSSYLRHADGYYATIADEEEERRQNWRPAVLKMLAMMSEAGQGNLIDHLASIEHEDNYWQRKTDVYPLEGRIQLEFKDEHQKNRAKWQVMAFLRQLEYIARWDSESLASMRDEVLNDYSAVLRNIRIVDESKPDLGKFQFYITLRDETKERMVDKGLKYLSADDSIDDLLIFGDQLPDLRAGCYAGDACRSAFLLVTGSPLAPYLRPGTNYYGSAYAGEDISWIRKRMVSSEKPGYFSFKAPGRRVREIVIGDVAYPGLPGPESIAAYLADRYDSFLDY